MKTIYDKPDDLPDIHIMSRDLARRVLRRAPRAVHHVISISDPEDGPPPEVEERLNMSLVLCFHDVSDPDDVLEMPTRRDVELIVKYAEAIRCTESVLCHCNAGISRSSAAALAVIATRTERSSDGAARAVDEVAKIKATIRPNRAMVEFMDEILGYEGDLDAAYRRKFNVDRDLLGFLK
jgi:predicted protein tyrosine phosphatase